MSDTPSTVADLVVECLEAEGVEYVFGIPGEENIRLVAATDRSPIRFVLVRDERGAAFMADIYGRLTGKAGVCTATLGPGALNLLLGVTDANTDSTPLVALTAQVGLNRIFKESHQSVDLVSVYQPVTKWAGEILTPAAVPEMLRKAFDVAQSERPGAVYLALPENVEGEPAAGSQAPVSARPVHHAGPDPDQIQGAIQRLREASNPIVLAGHGVARAGAAKELLAFAERLNLPVATTFMGKGVISDRQPNALGVVGFMRHDYQNFAFEQADLIVSVGYELQEFAPQRINPDGDKQIVHVHRFAEDVDAHYQISVDIEADIAESLTALTNAASDLEPFPPRDIAIRHLRDQELAAGEHDTSFPLKPQRIVSDIRKAMDDDDIVLVDTGALKMWMARLYPTYQPLTCLISNALSTMAWALPGAVGAKLARPQQKTLAVVGDGAFMMSSQELETAVRESIPLVVLVWVDNAYGLIKWKMDLELGEHHQVDFGNPDFKTYAESFGATGYRIEHADQLLPVLRKALADGGVHVIACPVDYSENLKLTSRLGELTIAL
jgi:acetolactate synthase-1/2/3 large subunit